MCLASFNTMKTQSSGPLASSSRRTVSRPRFLVFVFFSFLFFWGGVLFLLWIHRISLRKIDCSSWFSVAIERGQSSQSPAFVHNPLPPRALCPPASPLPLHRGEGGGYRAVWGAAMTTIWTQFRHTLKTLPIPPIPTPGILRTLTLTLVP